MPGKAYGIADAALHDLGAFGWVVHVEAGDAGVNGFFGFAYIARRPYRYVQFSVGPEGNIFPAMSPSLDEGLRHD